MTAAHPGAAEEDSRVGKHADLWPHDPEPGEPECDVCEDSREIAGWDEPKAPCPFCTLILLPEPDHA